MRHIVLATVAALTLGTLSPAAASGFPALGGGGFYGFLPPVNYPLFPGGGTILRPVPWSGMGAIVYPDPSYFTVPPPYGQEALAYPPRQSAGYGYIFHNGRRYIVNLDDGGIIQGPEY